MFADQPSRRKEHTLSAMEDCLSYMQSAVTKPGTVEPWAGWWLANQETVRITFDRRDYLKLKFRRLIAAREILERLGRIEPEGNEYAGTDFNATHCKVCGDELFWAIPGETTKEQIIEFAKRMRWEQIEKDAWIHPGVFCPNGCTYALHEYRSDWKNDESA